MTFSQSQSVVKTRARFKLDTGLMLRSGLTGEYTDSTIESTPDGRLHVNGYVWSSLIRRALNRITGSTQMAARIGKHNEGEMQVSPLWCESSFVYSPQTEVRNGNRICRRWGAAKPQALFSDQVAAPGHALDLAFNWFCLEGGSGESRETPETVKTSIRSALWVIHQGIETIGGGWSYGFGRLKLTGLTLDVLDLNNERDRQRLWQFDGAPQAVDEATVGTWQPQIRPERGWTRITADARVMDGQLLAISTKQPPVDLTDVPADKLPDTFVFRGPPTAASQGDLSQPVVITGKAVRQALLATALERETATREPDLSQARRDTWFGSTDRRGMVSVADAQVSDAKTKVLNRIQLCEHSMQNSNLFSGEYLCRGAFKTELLVETGDPEGRELATRITALLEQMKPDGQAPPGWHRLGHTATCTGQIQMTDLEQENFGGTP